MAINIKYEDHVVMYVSNLIAQKYGAHIKNVTVTNDTDNGTIVSLGDWIELDHYKDKDYTGDFKAVIRQASVARDNFWFVEVLEPGDAYLLYNVPITPYNKPRALKDPQRFYNAAGDQVRAYQLSKGDIFEISTDGIEGTPTAGAELEVKNGKLSVKG